MTRFLTQSPLFFSDEQTHFLLIATITVQPTFGEVLFRIYMQGRLCTELCEDDRFVERKIGLKDVWLKKDMSRVNYCAAHMLWAAQ